MQAKGESNMIRRSLSGPAVAARNSVHGAATLILDGPLSPILGAEDGLAAREALIEQATAMAVKAIAGG